MTKPNFTPRVARDLDIGESQVSAVLSLIAEGATVPFIARYRKEASGSLDEVAVAAIRDRAGQLKELEDMREMVVKSLEKNGHLTEDLKQKVLGAETAAALSDIYLPYRPKRRTRALLAKEKGLEPLALAILEQKGMDPLKEAEAFSGPGKKAATVQEALDGSRDIIAEIINEDETARARIRDLFLKKASVQCRAARGVEENVSKFRDYFDFEEPLARIPSHRALAIRRGENEKALLVKIAPDDEAALGILNGLFVKGDGPDSGQVALAVKDAHRRLLSRSMETEARAHSKEKADREAIRIFAENLRHLLLAPPLGPKRVMGIDPGFRTGCKLVCLDRQGKLLHHDVVFLHGSEKKAGAEAKKIKRLAETFQTEAIAVGNGTAGRETQDFIRKIEFKTPVHTVMVNESGASVYSASKVAREEFPDLDLTVRGAAAIGRRLMDPLAELVKIDPKSIGVGQYQHDVDQNALKKSLDDVVESCVNSVGVDVNRASAQLLSYVSGLSRSIVQNIVAFREENGPFPSRKNLLDVPRLGPKAFEQSAGFLRITGGENPLDASAVHPESYPIVEKMARDMDAAPADIMRDPDLRRQVDIARYVTDQIGLPTLTDIMAELEKPGRDPREKFEEFAFAEGIEKPSDLRPGMRLPGVVSNVTAFGAFVDIGVHEDGLVHISQMADRFVKDPAEIVKTAQKVTVTVLDVDLERNRISLSMKSGKPDSSKAPLKKGKNPPQRKPAPKKAGGRDRAKPKFTGSLADAFIKSGLKKK